MRFKTLLFTLSFLVAVGTVKAQDFHFTQFDMSPSTLNPALTGAYEGTFRIGGIYRDQWASVSSNPFRTPSFYIDMPVIRGFAANHWVGAGVSFLSDQVGAFNYQNTLAGGSLAYHMAFKDGTTVSIGGQVNNVQRRVDIAALQMEDGFDPTTGGFIPGAIDQANLNENASFMDVAAGLNVSRAFGTGDKVRVNAGVSAYHLNAPTDGFLGGETLPLRLTGHAKADIDLNEKLVLTPAVLYQNMAGSNEINAVAMIGYRLNPEFMVQYGQGWRVGDATNAIFAVQYNRLRVGASYDINISSLNNVTNAQGGFELAFSYIAHIFTAPKSKPVIFCPSF